MISLHFNFKFIINFRTRKSNWRVSVYRLLPLISFQLLFRLTEEADIFLTLYWILWFKIKIILIIWIALLIADTCQVLILLLGTIVNALRRLTSALKTLITAILSTKLDLPKMQMSLVTGFACWIWNTSVVAAMGWMVSTQKNLVLTF